MRFIFILFPFFVFSQQLKKPDTVFCDCSKARTVSLNGNIKIGPTIVPPGSGELNEISERKQKTKFSFEKEHYSAWYKLIIKTDGFLVFDIIPTKSEDDYDFMLFKGDTVRFCDSLLRFAIKPVRACISRNKEELKGLTGLNFRGQKELIIEGLGDAYAKPLGVKSGDVYYLILDNVYDNGGGHTINFYFEEMVAVKGVTLNEDKVPVTTEVTVTAPNGDTLKKVKSDKKGKYEFNIPLRKNVTYSLNFYNDSSFIFTRPITSKTNKDQLKNISPVLQTLKKGNKYILQNINFEPGVAVFIPSAYAPLKTLTKLMQRNTKLKIHIVGHINGCSGVTKKIIDQLSIDRAMAVKKYLESNSVSANRSTVDGKGCSEMLYPPGGEEVPSWQQVLNRRVEIFITEK
ncbi:MAG: OmpA family protein [Bacteroidia bacterium]